MTVRALLILSLLSASAANAALATFPVSGVQLEPMLRADFDGYGRTSRNAQTIVPLQDGSAYVLWTDRYESIYANGHRTYITRVDRDGAALSPTKSLASGVPRVVMNERVAFVVIGQQTCDRFAGCADFARLMIIDRATAAITEKVFSSEGAGTRWQNNYQVTWNGSEFVVLAHEGQYFPIYSTAPRYFVARFSPSGEMLSVRERSEWPRSSAILPATNGYAAVISSIPAEWTLHNDSGDVLARQPYPGRAIDFVAAGDRRLVLVDNGNEDQLWSADGDARPVAHLMSWKRSEFRAFDLAHDAAEVIVLLRDVAGNTFASRVTASEVTAPVRVPSVVAPNGNFYVGASIRIDVPGDAGQLYVQTAPSLEQLTTATAHLASLRARQQRPVAVLHGDDDTSVAIWSEATDGEQRVLLQRMTREGVRLDGEGVALPITGATDAARNKRAIAVISDSAAVWMTPDLSRMKRVELPEPAVPKKIVASPDGFLIYWTSNLTGVGQIVAARLSGPGDLLDPAGFFVIPTGVDQHNPAIAWTGEHFLMVFAQHYSPAQELLLAITLSHSGSPVGAAMTISSRLGTRYESVALAFRDGVGFVAWHTFPINPYESPVGARGTWISARGELLRGSPEDVGDPIERGVCCSSGAVLVVPMATRFLVALGSATSFDQWYSVPRVAGGSIERREVASDVVDAAPTRTGAAFIRAIRHDDFTYGVTIRAYLSLMYERRRPATP